MKECVNMPEERCISVGDDVCFMLTSDIITNSFILILIVNTIIYCLVTDM